MQVFEPDQLNNLDFCNQFEIRPLTQRKTAYESSISYLSDDLCIS